MTSIKVLKKRFEEVTNAVSRLVDDRYFFLEYKKYLEEHPNIDKNNEFLYFIGLNYVETTCLGIFRQVDRNPKSQSLLNILKTIQKEHESFTLGFFCRKYRRSNAGLGNGIKDFSQFALKDGKKISPKKVKSDILALIKITKPIVKYRHKFVAHRNIRKVTINVKMNDLYTVIDFLEKMVSKYQLLINQAGMPSLRAGNSHPNLQAVFKE
ncbi:MAG: hypothetical protein WCT29_00685 [Candidatus Paceibacterota bacterium]|jgi:hypothetical protein